MRRLLPKAVLLLGLGLLLATGPVSPWDPGARPSPVHRTGMNVKRVTGRSYQLHELDLPKNIRIGGCQNFAYSPDGSCVGVAGADEILIWSLATERVYRLPARADDEEHQATFGRFLWTDSSSVVVEERVAAKSDVQRIVDDPFGQPPSVRSRYVVISVDGGDRTKSVWCDTRGWYGSRAVVGIKDANQWYVRCADKKLRIYDAAADALLEGQVLDLSCYEELVVQTQRGSPWFFGLAPNDERSRVGTLKVVNVETGETRDVPNTPVSGDGTLTSSGTLLFTTGVSGDTRYCGMWCHIPTGAVIATMDQWAPLALSEANGVLLVVSARREGDALVESLYEIDLASLLEL